MIPEELKQQENLPLFEHAKQKLAAFHIFENASQMLKVQLKEPILKPLG